MLPSLSVTNTSATSSSRIGSTPSMPRSNRISSCSSSRVEMLSPADTMYCTPSSSAIYPAGMEKFCAVSRALTVLSCSTSCRFVCSSAEARLSSMAARPDSSWVRALSI